MSLLAAFAALSIVMGFAWLWQQRTSNIGWVDVFWTFGTAGAGVGLALAWAAPDGSALRRAIVCAICGLWAVRLGLFVAFRVASADEEDGRYRALREAWGPTVQRRLLSFLLLQALVSTVLAVAIALAANRPERALGWADMAGLGIGLLAIAGEALADHQLRTFAAAPENRGRVCDVGLWAWSRHPNYVFEWLGWCAYPAFGIDLSGRYPWGWATLLAPVLMFLVLRFGTGVPPLEAHMLRSRGQAYRTYQDRVAIFLPRPPKLETLRP